MERKWDTLLGRDEVQQVQNDDSRVGSARGGGSSDGTLSQASTGSSSSNSVAVLTSLIPVAVYFAICLLLFICLRRRWDRIYQPRALLSSLKPQERSPRLPSGWFNWIRAFYQIPDTQVLRSSSLDGFLFLRYLKVLISICVFGCCVTWPILLPVDVTGGGDKTQLDSLTFGNITDTQRYYAHVAVGYVFFGFVLYVVSRECIFCIYLRQAYLLSPSYSSHPRSRTVLFMGVPDSYADETTLRGVLGPSAKRIWLPRSSKDLDLLVQERIQLAKRLERAEIRLITTADRARRNGSQLDTCQRSPDHYSPDDSRGEDQAHSTDQTPTQQLAITKYGDDGPPPDVFGSVAAQWIPYSSRPTHRPIMNFFRSVDTIKWSRFQIRDLNKQIRKFQKRMGRGDCGHPVPVAFVEFDSQFDAQLANQAVLHPQPFRMSQRLLGVRPYEVVWDSLQMSWLQRAVRRFLTYVFIVAMIIFWSIPSAIVGMLSNIQFLADTIPFLGWVQDLPTPILGVLTGLVPALALSLLMAIVPSILRACARFAGVATLPRIELFTQHAYFAFQVVQVFLITTFTSAASAAVTSVIQDPTSAPTMLSQNLPKASNFYLSYFVIQCFALSASDLLQIGNALRFSILDRFSRNPRLLATRWHSLERLHWGSIFPVFSNFAVIAISYSCIAPIILGVAALGIFVVYQVYRYNLIFVYDSKIDTDGLVYPRALLHTFTGLYIGQVCLVGLFILRTAFGPTVLSIIFLTLTVLIHISLNDAMAPLLYGLPSSLVIQDKHPMPEEKDPLRADDVELGYVSDDEPPDIPSSVDATEKSFEGSHRLFRSLSHLLMSILKEKVLPELRANEQVNKIIHQASSWSHASSKTQSHFSLLSKWLPPASYANHASVHAMVSELLPSDNDGDSEPVEYIHPSLLPAPTLYIPRDEGGVSQQEVAHSSRVIKIRDDLATLGEHGRVSYDHDTLPAEVAQEIAQS